MTMIERAKRFAEEKHAGIEYDGQPYSVAHLAVVVGILIEFGFTDENMIAAGWLHDSVEDTDATIEEIEAKFNAVVAALVWAVTGVGARRKERNQSMYVKVAAYVLAAILKLADRIANVESGVRNKTRHVQMYWDEMKDFEPVIRPHVPPMMWQRLLDAFAAGGYTR